MGTGTIIGPELAPGTLTNNSSKWFFARVEPFLHLPYLIILIILGGPFLKFHLCVPLSFIRSVRWQLQPPWSPHPLSSTGGPPVWVPVPVAQLGNSRGCSPRGHRTHFVCLLSLKISVSQLLKSSALQTLLSYILSLFSYFRQRVKFGLLSRRGGPYCFYVCSKTLWKTDLSVCGRGASLYMKKYENINNPKLV